MPGKPFFHISNPSRSTAVRSCLVTVSLSKINSVPIRTNIKIYTGYKSNSSWTLPECHSKSMHWEEFSLQIKSDFCLDLERNILHRNDDISITELFKEALICLTFPLNSCPTCLHTSAISIYKRASILIFLEINIICHSFFLKDQSEVWTLAHASTSMLLWPCYVTEQIQK